MSSDARTRTNGILIDSAGLEPALMECCLCSDLHILPIASGTGTECVIQRRYAGISRGTAL